jgi:hypothetical protein
MDAFESSAADVVYPVSAGRRGHPPLIRLSTAERLSDWRDTGNLKECLRSVKDSEEIEVGDRGINIDMDFEDEYKSAAAAWETGTIPARDECLYILEKYEAGKDVIAHAAAVERAASDIADGLAPYGVKLDKPLLSAAALLHDIDRDRPNHAEAGARTAARLGYPRLAPLIRTHMDFTADISVSEAAVLYLADKAVRGKDIIGLEARRKEYREKFAGNPRALESVDKRLDTAAAIKRAIEAAMKP